MFKKKYLAVAGLMALAVVISGCGKKKEKEESAVEVSAKEEEPAEEPVDEIPAPEEEN